MPGAAPRSRGGATATVSRPQCLAPPWSQLARRTRFSGSPQICDATTLAFPATELSVPCQEPAGSAQWLISVSRDGLHARRFHNAQCQLDDSFQKYIHATWAVRDHKKQGSVRKFVFVTPDSARREHRSSLASEEHICGLTSPRTPRRHTVSTASPNRPGATPKAEQAAATPGGCCHKRLPTPPVTLPNVPGRAPWWFSTDDKPSSNNQSTPCATSILKSRRRG